MFDRAAGIHFALGNGPRRSLASPPLMKHLFRVVLVLLAGTMLCRAQFNSFGEIPIEIDSLNTRYEGGVAIAEDNVVIHYDEVTIYSDYAQYNPDTRDVLVRGNVRIYNGGQLFTGERAIYNLETKQLRGSDFSGDQYPFRFSAGTISSTNPKEYLVKDAIFTTSDSSKPDYQIKAKSVRIYPGDRVIFTNATFYLGKLPVFWFPYLWQSLQEDTSFTITPGFNSIWGAFALGQYTFPISDTAVGQVRLDLRSTRGIGVGFESRYTYGKNEMSWGNFRSYYIDDASPGTSRTGDRTLIINPNRYRIGLEDRHYFTDDIYANINFQRLSDPEILGDFFEGEYYVNPQPDNVVSVTKWDENYTLTLITRYQLNRFFETTERLPEFVLDTKRQPIFGDSGLFYEGESGAAYLRRGFGSGSQVQDYDTYRLDSFHQISYPGTYFGFLSFDPRVGVRGTYYGKSGIVGEPALALAAEQMLQVDNSLTPRPINSFITNDGPVFRPVVNAGFESSFKFSRAFEQVQSRGWGLDGLRHVVQPYLDASFVYAGKDPEELYQFDRYNPSTQLPPLDFPEFTGVDSITDWSVVRLGVHNRLETRRDNQTFSWLDLDTFVEVNLDEPKYPGVTYEEGTFSNVFNNLKWNPVPWFHLNIASQLPLLDSGFTEVNTSLNFFVNSDLQFTVGDRYINGNPFFENSNQVSFGGFYRFNENWSVDFSERYEFEVGRLESQYYEINRALSSWVASFGVYIDNNGTKTDYGVLLTFTLKQMPDVSFPVAFDPAALLPGSTSR